MINNFLNIKNPVKNKMLIINLIYLLKYIYNYKFIDKNLINDEQSKKN